MTDKTQPTAHAEITAPISADLRRIDDAGAKSAPITLMTEDRACTWAWDQVQQDVGTKGWTAGDSCNFYGFFLWGWNYRGQYETQSPAAPPAPAAVDGRTPPDMLVNGGALKLALNVLRRAGKNEVADELEKTAAPAQEHATQLAGQWLDLEVTDEMALAFHRAISDGAIGQDDVDDIKDGLRAALCDIAAPAQTQGCTRSHPHEEMTPMCVLRTEIARLDHAAAIAQVPFQQRVQPWLLACFGAEIAADKQERNHRFLEESVELVQANGCTLSEAHQLVDYVYGRPVGELTQEVGGVMVTLAALCLASGVDMHQAGETELARIWGKVEQIRAKQAAKPKHSPLPAAPAQAQEDAPIVWPRSRDVGRIGDMSMTASLRVGLDGDNDTYVNVWDENGGASIEFCTPGAGGGKSRRTRVALLALMVAMEADNAEDPRRDWWAARATQGGA